MKTGAKGVVETSLVFIPTRRLSPERSVILLKYLSLSLTHTLHPGSEMLVPRILRRKFFVHMSDKYYRRSTRRLG